MEKERKNTVLLTVIGIATLLVAIVGATFAYFTAIVTTDETQSTIVVTSSNGGTSTFTGGDAITVNNIYPKGTLDNNPWAQKVVTLHYENANAINPYTYQLKLHYTNTFAAGQLYYSFTNVTSYCTDYTVTCASATGTATAATLSGGTTSGTIGATASSPITLGSVTIAANDQKNGGVTHAYVLKISYPDSGTNQNYTGETKNQEANLTAYVEIVEVPTSNS